LVLNSSKYCPKSILPDLIITYLTVLSNVAEKEISTK